MLFFGTATVDITPRKGLLMAGYPNAPERIATGIHDRLYTSAFYFSDGTKELLYLTNDLVSIMGTRSSEAKKQIEKKTGILESCIMIGCTHTHSGPVTRQNPDSRFTSKEELYPDYNDFLRDCMVKASQKAKKTSYPAEIGFGKTLCGKALGIGGNRHSPDGIVDPEVMIMAIRDEIGSIRGCIVNYALHPTLLHRENRLYSADFPGYLRKNLETAYPRAVIGFMEGCAGNQSTRFFRTGQTFEEAKRYGDTLADVAKKAISQMSFSSQCSLCSLEKKVMPPLKNALSLDDAERALSLAKSKLQKLERENAPYTLRRTAECTLFGAQYNVRLAKAAEEIGINAIRSVNFPMRLQVMQIGDVAIAGMSCEAFVELGLEVKKRSPFSITFLSTVTNGGSDGYACTDEAYDKFCYEAQTSMFSKGAIKFLADELTEMLLTL